MPVLTINTTIILAPAAIETSPATAPVSPPRRRSLPAGSPGGGLAEAVRNINEGERVLAETRRHDVSSPASLR